MERERAEQIVEVLLENGVEASLYEDYSGRGMYGKTTTGIKCDSRDDVLYAAGIADQREGAGWDPDLAVDRLGHGYIIY